MKIAVIVSISILSFYSCHQKSDSIQYNGIFQTSISQDASDTVNINCIGVRKVIKHKFSYGNDTSLHWERTFALPAMGRFVMEAHYVTMADIFPGNRLFAETIDENILNHLRRSFEVYKQFDPNITFERLYSSKWMKEWTPAESGKIGQGSVGDVQKKELTKEVELWMMNMMWAPGEKPQRGTKYLLSANGKKVVVIAGYETGPAQKEYLGGVTCEVHCWLGTNSNSIIKVEFLKDQLLKTGPIKCK